MRRDRVLRQLQITFPQKVIEAAREHLPALLQSDTTPKLLKGAKFRDAIDSLKLVEPRPAKLTKTQVDTQRLVGSLKYISVLQALSAPLPRAVQRVKDGEIVLRHVVDDMPADFLTKWIPAKKLEQSVRYATNSHYMHK